MVLSWKNNWDDQTVFFQFPLETRKIIYTTILIENLNGKIRKYTKSKLSFLYDEAVKKTVYLFLMKIEKMDDAYCLLGIDYELIYAYLWKQNSDIGELIAESSCHLDKILDSVKNKKSQP